MNKIVVYAISENGNGFVQEIGRYDSVEDIEILTGHFAKDIKIKIENQTYEAE